MLNTSDITTCFQLQLQFNLTEPGYKMNTRLPSQLLSEGYLEMQSQKIIKRRDS